MWVSAILRKCNFADIRDYSKYNVSPMSSYIIYEYFCGCVYIFAKRQQQQIKAKAKQPQLTGEQRV